MSHRWQLRVRGALSSAGLAWLGLLAIASPAGATTLRRMDLPELVSAADRIVHARALGNSVAWDDTGTQIHTDTTFEIIAEAKGQGPATLTVTLLGGRIDPVEMKTEGAPVFGIGEELVLFTLNRPDGKENLVGFTQGVMRVLTEADGDKIAVSEVPLGVTILQVSGPQATVVRPSPLRAPLGTLIEEIRQMVDGTRPAGPIISTTPETDPVAAGSEVP